ncbi:MAG: N-acetylmuramoyl-L-alanine amidase [Prevotella sp.]|nr:N-acetylmuramoyl-L-alanine amidase [Prevotella sp.]
MKKIIICTLSTLFLATIFTVYALASCKKNNGDLPHYKEIPYPTPNIEPDTVNDVQGVVLHHTAEPTVEKSLEILSSPEKKVSTHVVIDYDGTRYIMAAPTDVTWHAGRSILGDREECNFFTIGIEFQGNTLEKPLTNDQINSAIEYLLPLIRLYNIPMENIVTHEMVRKTYKKKHPDSKVYNKYDITQKEYHRFIKALSELLPEPPVRRGG